MPNDPTAARAVDTATAARTVHRGVPISLRERGACQRTHGGAASQQHPAVLWCDPMIVMAECQGSLHGPPMTAAAILLACGTQLRLILV